MAGTDGRDGGVPTVNGIKRMVGEVAPQALGANVIDIRSTVTQRTGSECESARKPIRMEQKTLNLESANDIRLNFSQRMLCQISEVNDAKFTFSSWNSKAQLGDVRLGYSDLF